MAEHPSHFTGVDEMGLPRRGPSELDNRVPAALDRDETEALAIGVRHLLGFDTVIPDLREFNPLLRSALRKLESR